MDEPADADLLIGRLYEAVIDRSLLPDVLARTTAWLDGGTCHLVGWAASGVPLFSTSVGLDDDIGPTYAEHYAAIDPRRQFAAAHYAPGELLLCHEHFDRRFVARSEFFQDYLLPLGLHHMMATTLVDDGTALVQIAFHREVGREHFAPAQSGRLRRLVPHLRRAVALMLRHDQVPRRDPGDAAALQHAALGTISLDGAGRMVGCSRLADAWLRRAEALCVRHGRLHASAHGDDRALDAALSQCLQTGTSRHLLVGSRFASPDQPVRRYSVTLVPLRSAERFAMHPGARVVCIVSPLDARRVATANQLVALFRLTPAEARLARALAAGSSLDGYARECGVGSTTVRSQLSSILAKTGCDRQASLVRLLCAVPAVRDPR